MGFQTSKKKHIAAKGIKGTRDISRFCSVTQQENNLNLVPTGPSTTSLYPELQRTWQKTQFSTQCGNSICLALSFATELSQHSLRKQRLSCSPATRTICPMCKSPSCLPAYRQVGSRMSVASNCNLTLCVFTEWDNGFSPSTVSFEVVSSECHVIDLCRLVSCFREAKAFLRKELQQI